MITKNKLTAKLIFILLIFCGCSQFQNEKKGVSSDKPAKKLIIVVENNNILDDYFSDIYDNAMFNDDILTILSGILSVDKGELSGKSLLEISDLFLEDWQINEIKRSAKACYDTIVSFTDNQATYENFLSELKNSGIQTIDVIFSLHGNTGIVCFSDGNGGAKIISSQKIKDDMTRYDIKIRSLYQTCCYGASMIDDWKLTGIKAVNGTDEINYVVLAAPIFFMQNWLNGATYEDAVNSAYAKETDLVKFYLNNIDVTGNPDKAAAKTLMISLYENNISKCLMKTGGFDPEILW
jgi:hypothetical protein